MKFVVAGAGAVGAYLGARMARAGQDVTLFARGAHLRAMQERGIQVRSAAGDFEARPKVTGELESIGAADVVFLAVKAHSLPELAPRLKALFGPETAVVSMQNGIPWWYFQNHGGELEGLRLERVDPGGVISSAIEARRVVGSIVYFATSIVEPGVIAHEEGNRICLGEPSGARSERCRRIAEALIAAGLRCPITTKIRQEIWVKLLGNVAFNPISALTGATLAQMARDPEVSALVRRIMTEASCAAGRLGIELPVSIEQRVAGAEKVGEHKTSMLQDVAAGKPTEIEAIVGAVIEIGEKLGVSMTSTRAVYACTKLLEKTAARKKAQGQNLQTAT
jgi:2-dehydropantoate 2-reductase